MNTCAVKSSWLRMVQIFNSISIQIANSIFKHSIFRTNNCKCSGCRTVTRKLVTLAYFSVCLRRSLVTRVLERGECLCGWPSDTAYTNSNELSLWTMTISCIFSGNLNIYEFSSYKMWLWVQSLVRVGLPSCRCQFLHFNKILAYEWMTLME